MGRGGFSFDLSGGDGAFFDGEKRFAGLAIEYIHVAGLGYLGYRIDSMPIPLDGDEVRGGREIAIPKVVVDRLKMPYALAGRSIQGQQGIGEKVVAFAIGSVEIEGGGTGGNEDQAALFVEAHAGPVIGAADVLPRVFGPGIVAELAGMRDGVKGPANFSGARVESTHVARGCGQSLADDTAHDDEVFIDDAGGGGGDGHFLGRAAQTLAQIHASVFTEGFDECAGAGIERIQPVAGRKKDALVAAAGPVGDAAIARFAIAFLLLNRIEGPAQFAAGGIERDEAQFGGGGVEGAIHDDGVALHFGIVKGVTGIEGPGDG